MWFCLVCLEAGEKQRGDRARAITFVIADLLSWLQLTILTKQSFSLRIVHWKACCTKT